MKKIVLFISIILLVSCNRTKLKKDVKPTVVPKEVKGVYEEIDNQIVQDAKIADYSAYKGKVIRDIMYCDGCEHSGDLIIITFTDDTKLSIYGYKYNMKIYY